MEAAARKMKELAQKLDRQPGLTTRRTGSSSATGVRSAVRSAAGSGKGNRHRSGRQSNRIGRV